jgi:hypothetical protein
VTLGRCNAIGCRAAILDVECFCSRHLAMVESDTRRVFERSFRPCRLLQSKVFVVSLERAQREILYFVTEGHRIPRARAFEFDDDGARQ